MIDNKVVHIAAANTEKHIREQLDANYYDNTADNDQVSVDSFKKYFLPRVKTEN